VRDRRSTGLFYRSGPRRIAPPTCRLLTSPARSPALRSEVIPVRQANHVHAGRRGSEEVQATHKEPRSSPARIKRVDATHCPEARIFKVHRAALQSSGDAGTALTNLMTGRPSRRREFGPMGEAPKFSLVTGAVAPLRAKAEAPGSEATRPCGPAPLRSAARCPRMISPRHSSPRMNASCAASLAGTHRTQTAPAPGRPDGSARGDQMRRRMSDWVEGGRAET
jgi:hypothetical protein